MKIIKSYKVFYKCFTCKKIKLPKFFYVGHTSKCKECIKNDYKNNKSTRKTYYLKNKEKIKKYYEENKDRLYTTKSDKIKMRTKIWKKNNPDKVRKYKRKEHLREARDIGKNSLW